MATLPQQPPGPGPTAQPLPSYLSYSAAATTTIAYTSTLTQVVYDPQGSFAPYQTVSVVQGTTTSVEYEVVNVPLLYTGPFPAPDLGSLFTTPGQRLTATGAAAGSTATGPSSNGNASPTSGETIAGTAATATPTGTSTETSATLTESGTLPTGQNTATAETTQSDPSTAESAPSTSPTPSQSGISSSTVTQATSPTTIPTTTALPTSDSSNSFPATTLDSTSGTSSTSSNPSATAAGMPNPNSLASTGLSGGQIAGIVLGAFFALLLLLLLLLCCLRRRRKRHQERVILAAATGSGGGGARGNYSTLAAGAGDGESDNLTSGDGFFVVGGRRVSSRQASTASRRSVSHYPTANIPPSSSNTSGWSSLAAAGAGFFGAALGRRRERERGRVEIEEEDDDEADGSVAERRGLMLPSHESPGSPYGGRAEMREGSGRVFAPPSAVLAGVGGATYGAHRQGVESGSPQRPQSRPTSSALSGSNSSGSNTQRGLISSSNSTGGFTTTASGTSLPPPPRAPRTSPTAVTYGNVEPSHGSPFAGSTSQPQRLSAGTTDSTASANSALLGIGSGAALGGLGALAAGHRESDGSYARRKPVPSHASELSAEELGHLRTTDPERYSRFISTGSTLLGPGYRSSPEEEGSPMDGSTAAGGGAGGGGSASQPTRLATIRSVGDIGEAGSSRQATSGPYGSLGASSGSRHVVSPLPVYQPQDAQTGENLPHYTAQPGAIDRRHSGTEEFKTPLSELPARFDTPPDSPDQIFTGEARRLEQSDRSGAELAETTAASAGILGGVAAEWRRLTMGQYAWVPASTREQEASSSSVDSEVRGSFDQRPSEDSSRLLHRGSRLETSEPGVTSQRASVYGPSALGHGASSKDASGSSGERVPAARSHPSLSSHHSSNRSRGGGYSSSSGRRTTSDSTGLDSLSAAAQPSTGSASHRSSSHGRSGVSEVSVGSMETGAASYSPSGGVLSRDNTTSTCARDESVATGHASYAPSRRSGEASSVGVSDSDVASSMATGGSSSLERRKRPRSGDGMSRLDSLREGEEANDPFEEVAAVEELSPIGGHYPSATLGDAVSRSAARDSQADGEEGSLDAQRLPQRSRIRTLQPGSSAPAQTALAPSLSNRSLRGAYTAEPHYADTRSSSNIPASASWRPSPRVASASQHAAEALLRPQQQPQGPRDGGPTPPRSETGAQHRGASYSWADADVETTAAAQTPGEESQSDEEDRWNRSFDWPKFLKF